MGWRAGSNVKVLYLFQGRKRKRWCEENLLEESFNRKELNGTYKREHFRVKLVYVFRDFYTIELSPAREI